MNTSYLHGAVPLIAPAQVEGQVEAQADAEAGTHGEVLRVTGTRVCYDWWGELPSDAGHSDIGDFQGKCRALVEFVNSA